MCIEMVEIWPMSNEVSLSRSETQRKDFKQRGEIGDMDNSPQQGSRRKMRYEIDPQRQQPQPFKWETCGRRTGSSFYMRHWEKCFLVIKKNHHCCCHHQYHHLHHLRIIPTSTSPPPPLPPPSPCFSHSNSSFPSFSSSSFSLFLIWFRFPFNSMWTELDSSGINTTPTLKLLSVSHHATQLCG